MNLLVVEDEIRLRERIVGMIPWEEHEIALTGAVTHGGEALALMHQFPVDIVLTDIEMPEMSGLELASEIHARYPHVKIIILSGHSDFEYAQQSILYGVIQYLIKPASNEDILKSVQAAASQRNEELRAKHNYEALKSKWEAHLTQLQDVFLKNWAEGRYNAWEIETKSRNVQLELAGILFVPVVLDIDPIQEEDARYTAKDASLLYFSLHSIAREYTEALDCRTWQNDEGPTVALFRVPPDGVEEEIYHRINQSVVGLLDTVKSCLKVTASAGIGSIVALPERLPDHYRQAKQALLQRTVLGNNLAIPYRQGQTADPAWRSLAKLEQKLEAQLEVGEEQEALVTVAALVEAAFVPPVTVTGIREALLQISGLFARLAHQRDWLLSEVAGEDFVLFENIGALKTREQIHDWLRRMTIRWCTYASERRRSGTQVTVQEMLHLIDAHLGDEISLNKVSSMLYMNASYLSRLFKEELGMTFSDYLIRRRMERAKELLNQGLKVYEAAEQVGYRHVNYFSKTFQKYWGVKPGEYTQ
ncbi:response regulator [Paenibacillus daejeonensis]|uniref:response regulator n=1 Tax=Paenibacillus daejeonensis TaxID=135193 RepID=UPI0003685D48|nr:response regulator [Paenibacillus daejeonensis]